MPQWNCNSTGLRIALMLAVGFTVPAACSSNGGEQSRPIATRVGEQETWRSITFDDSFPPEVARDLRLVATDVQGAVMLRFGVAPLVDLPIVIRYSDGGPSTIVDEGARPMQIVITTTVRDRDYTRFALQFGHELGHVMLDAKLKAWQGEVASTSLGLDVLRQLAEDWKTHSVETWRPFASEFANYRSEVLREAFNALPDDLRQASVAGKQDVVRNGVATFFANDPLVPAGEERRRGPFGSHEMLAAELLLAGEVRWEALQGLIKCADPPQYLHVDAACALKAAPFLERVGLKRSWFDRLWPWRWYP